MNHPATHRPPTRPPVPCSPAHAARSGRRLTKRVALLSSAFALAAPLAVAPSIALAQVPGVPAAPGTALPTTRPPALPAPAVDKEGSQLTPLKAAAALAPAQTTIIQKYVAAKVALLTGADATASRDARLHLAAAATNNNAAATPAYQAAFAAAVNAEVLKALDAPEARARVAAAIALHNVAAQTKQPALAPAAQKAMADRALPVVMWGVRAGKHVYPLLLDNDKTQAAALTMAGALINAVRAYPGSVEIVEDAYDGLAGVEVLGQPARTKRGLTPLVQWLQARATLFAKVDPIIAAESQPDVFPASPAIETRSPGQGVSNLYVTLFRAWGADIKPVEKEAYRALHDLCEQLARIAPTLPAGPAAVGLAPIPGVPGAPAAPAAPSVSREMMNHLTVVAGTISSLKGAPAPIAAAAAQLFKDAKAGNAPAIQADMVNLTAAMTQANVLGNPMPPGPPPTAAPAPAPGAPKPVTRPAGGAPAAAAKPNP